jgi:hypothetical protein
MPHEETHMRFPALRNFFYVMSTLALVACGGGGGSSDSSNAPATPPAQSTSQPVVSSGTITGFGSVHVNGVHFETTHTTFMINGRSGSQGDLHVGDVVTVRGRHGDDGNGVADRIDFADAVKGPLDSVDTIASKLVVLGQTVLVDADTSFDDNITGAVLAGLVAGDLVEVSGMRRADGSIQATRIEKQPAGTVFEVTGRASQVDTTARKLHVNALVVDYSTATVQGFPSGQPKDGDLIEAKGATLNAAQELLATSLELETADVQPGDNAMRNEIEGLITRYVSATDFDVAGKAVTTTASTRFENGIARDLALNVKVEVEGPVNVSGVLAASKVQFKRASSARIEARVDSVDRAANTVTVLGIVVTVNGTTRLEDKGDTRVTNFSLADLATGDYVEIRGAETSTGKVIASRLERRRVTNEVRLRGVVSAVARPAFTLLGVTVQTTNATRFNDGTETFFTTAQGKIVQAKGSVDGGSFVAREVEFEND